MAAETMIELRQVSEHGKSVRRGRVDHVLDVQEGGDAQLRLRQAEGQGAVAARIPRIQPAEVEQVGPVAVHQGAKGQAVAPRRRHVGDLDAGALQAAATPLLQCGHARQGHNDAVNARYCLSVSLI